MTRGVAIAAAAVWFASSVACAEDLAGDGQSFAVALSDNVEIKLVLIRAGAFTMGRQTAGSGLGTLLNWEASGPHVDEGPPRRVVLTSDFAIGRYKTTCDEYCQFLNSVDKPAQHIVLNKFARIEIKNGRYEAKPGCASSAVNTVPWAGADAYCQWLSQRVNRTVRLPTEAEWEYVARGSQGRRHPWGDGRRNVGAAAPSRRSSGCRSVDDFLGDETPVGVVGMADPEVGEWCSDYYGVVDRPDDLIDPQGPAKDELPVPSGSPLLAAYEGEDHVPRGRSSRTTNRAAGSEVRDSGIYGFRIVVDVP